MDEESEVSDIESDDEEDNGDSSLIGSEEVRSFDSIASFAMDGMGIDAGP